MSKNKNKNKKDDPRTIYKIHAETTLVAVICPDINSDFDNVVLEFVEFDNKTNKKLFEIDIYYTLPAFLSLCQMIKDRTLIGMIKADKARCQQNNIKYSNAKLLSHRGGGEVDDVVKYREDYFCCASSPNLDGVITAEIMDGEENAKGLINPKYTNSSVTNKKTIRVPFRFNDLYNMAMISQYRFQAFFTAKQLRGDFDRGRQDNPVEQGFEQVNVQAETVSEVQASSQPEAEPQYAQGYQLEEESSYNAEFNSDQAFYDQFASQYGY